MRVLRVLCYVWSAPTTALGLLFVPIALLSRGGVQIVDGVVEIYGGGVRWVLRHCTLLRTGAAAMTLGHVVLGCDRETLDRTRTHERIHVRQCDRWGLCFIPAYLLSSVWALLHRRDPYRDNAFEREAYENG